VASHRAGGDYAFGWFALPGALWSLVAGYSFLPDTFSLHSEGGRAALRYLPVALAAAPALGVCGVLGPRAFSPRAGPGALLPPAAALLGPFAAHLVLGVSLNPRYFQSAVPAVLVLLAIGATTLGAWQQLARGAGIAVGVLLASATALQLAEPGHGREDVVA